MRGKVMPVQNQVNLSSTDFPELSELTQDGGAVSSSLLSSLQEMKNSNSRVEATKQFMNEASHNSGVSITRIISLDFHYDPSKPIPSNQIQVTTEETNRGNSDPSPRSVTLSNTISRSSHFDIREGRVRNVTEQTSSGDNQGSKASGSISSKLKVGIPLLATEEVNVQGNYERNWGHHEERLTRIDNSTSEQVSFGGVDRRDVTFSRTVNLTLRPDAKKEVSLIVYETEADIPFTAKVAYSDGMQGTISGVWEGTLLSRGITSVRDLP